MKGLDVLFGDEANHTEKFLGLRDRELGRPGHPVLLAVLGLVLQALLHLLHPTEIILHLYNKEMT